MKNADYNLFRGCKLKDIKKVKALIKNKNAWTTPSNEDDSCNLVEVSKKIILQQLKDREAER